MKTVMMFPGQGSLKYEHLAASYNLGYEARNFIDYICNVAGEDFKNSFFNNENALSESIFAQQALFVVLMASFINKFENYSDITLAGHSLGEVIAVTASGMVDFKTGFEIVTKRAKLMAEKEYDSFMAAVIGLAEDIVNIVASESYVYPANYNSPKQTVVAGLKEHFDVFKEKILSHGGKIVTLNVKVPSHTPLMIEASEQFYDFLKNIEFKESRFPLFGCEIPDFITPLNVQNRLSMQIIKPVLWKNAINFLIDNGFDNFIETGFSNILSGLFKKIALER